MMHTDSSMANVLQHFVYVNKILNETKLTHNISLILLYIILFN